MQCYLDKMLSLGKETYIFFEHDRAYKAYQLPLLKLNPVEFSESERLRKYLTSPKLYYRINRIMRRIDGRRLCYEKEEGKYDINILRKDNVFLAGYFQTEKYFEDISEIIRSKIYFEGSDDSTYSEIAKKMNEENSVSIHVRLTDYVQLKKIYGGICDTHYYQKAIEMIREKVNNPVFYLFSDDLDAAQKMLSEYKTIPVSLNRGSKSYLDMFLMSQCRNHIIANSTFSWWGAWLNSHHDKIVIAPKRWLNTAEMPDICPKNWIRIEKGKI